MFNFFKKNKVEKPTPTPVVETQLSDAEIIQIKDTIKAMMIETKELETADPQQVPELATLQEKIGLAYSELGETDKAIDSFEKSLSLKLSIGEGYKKLMSLYNAKRAESARNGDDAGIEKYMNKMDEMRQIAKKVTLSGK